MPVAAGHAPCAYEMAGLPVYGSFPLGFFTATRKLQHAAWDTMPRGTPCRAGYHAARDTMPRGIGRKATESSSPIGYCCGRGGEAQVGIHCELFRTAAAPFTNDRLHQVRHLPQATVSPARIAIVQLAEVPKAD